MKMATNITITAELRPCYVGGEKALFHRWIEKETPFVKLPDMVSENETDRYLRAYNHKIILPRGDVVLQKTVLGIVEYDDGTVAEVEPTNIKFADNTINEYAFNERKASNEN